MRRVSIAEAKAHLSEIIDQARAERVKYRELAPV